MFSLDVLYNMYFPSGEISCRYVLWVAIGHAWRHRRPGLYFARETPSAGIGNTVCRTYDAAERDHLLDSSSRG